MLEQRFNPRHNSFDALRLVLAGLVAIDHGIIMRTGVIHRYKDSALGDFAVDGFFVLSGFLVSRSYLRLQSLPRYLWHRGLRIMPGFWACLLLTALIAAPLIAVLEGRTAASVFTTEPTAQQYVTNNAFLLMRQFDIAGLVANSPSPGALDGSLWTLFYEALCYAMIAGLGVFGILSRRRWVVLVLTVAVWAVNVAQAAHVFQAGEYSSRLVLLFLFGTLAHLYADRLPVSTPWVIAAVAIFAVGLIFAEPYRIAAGPAYAYLLIWLGACAPFAVSIRTDLSYGLYIYHFLIFQIMMVTVLAVLPIPLFVIVGTAISLAISAGSWFLIEHPALSRKSGPFIQDVETRVGAIKQALVSRLPVRRSLKPLRSTDIVRSRD